MKATQHFTIWVALLFVFLSSMVEEKSQWSEHFLTENTVIELMMACAAFCVA